MAASGIGEDSGVAKSLVIFEQDLFCDDPPVRLRECLVYQLVGSLVLIAVHIGRVNEDIGV